ncbi:MAG: type II toxin-antitoxin system PemK/MazF family toxin [Proteobacteria bacterium]|nr:type II toxin-antitoxin system PemK/MazF family toxin [Pseudomonadota bacterium]
MKAGDLILLPFPFAELTSIKVRPAVVIGITADKYKDLIVSAISSIVPEHLNKIEILIAPGSKNGLRVKSVIKVDRIVTVKRDSIIATLGKLSPVQLTFFKQKFKNIIV